MLQRAGHPSNPPAAYNTIPSNSPRCARSTNFPSSRRSTINGRRQRWQGVNSFRRSTPVGGTRATVASRQ